MRHRAPSISHRPLALGVATIGLTIGLAGCVTVDRWSVFTPEYPRRDGGHARSAARLPERRTPTSVHPVPEALIHEGVLELSVEQAVMLALAHNRELVVAQWQPVINGAFEQIERGRFDPELFAQASFNRQKAIEVARSTGTQFPVRADDSSVSAGLRQTLPTGAELELALSQRRTSSNRSPELQEGRIGLSLTQQLLRGMGPAVGLASVEQARLETLASEHELRGFIEARAADTEIAYWEYALAQARITIFEKSLSVARRQQDEVNQRIEVGVLPRTEAAAASAEVALREQALIDARSDLQAKRLRLLRLTSPEGDRSLSTDIRTTTAPAGLAEPIRDTDERIALALQSRPDLHESRLRLEQGRLRAVVTRNGLLPRLELFALLGKTGYGQSFHESLAVTDDSTYDATVGLRLSHYLNNRAAEGEDLAARATRSQAAAAVANLEELVRLDVRLAVNELERARQQITASAATRQLQEQTLRAEQERFEVRTRTALDVAQAQRDLLESQVREAEAVIGYRIALVHLHLAEGTVLQRRGIELGTDGR